MSETNRLAVRLDADLISLRALVAIAEEGSFSAAARRIGRTQSAVSLQIAKLEDRLGTRLLERTSRSVRQTPAGETLVAYARRILALADEAAMAVSAPSAGAPLRIGFAEYLAPAHLNDLLARFRRAHPAVPLTLKLGSGADLLARLAERDLDLVVAGPEGTGGRMLRTEPLVWVGAEDAGAGVTVPAEPLSLILNQPPCSYRQAAFGALTGAGRTWHVTLEANSVEGVRSAVAAGLGVSVLARSAVTAGLRTLGPPLPPLPDTAMTAYAPERDRHPLAERFVRFLEDGLRV